MRATVLFPLMFPIKFTEIFFLIIILVNDQLLKTFFTRCHSWSLVVTRGHSWSLVVIRDHSWSLVCAFRRDPKIFDTRSLSGSG